MREDFEKRMKDRGRRWQERMERRAERRKMHSHNNHGHIWTGVFLLIVGAIALLKSFMVPMPVWFFSWQTFLIGLGIFTGIRHRFRNPTWFILIFVGSAFLVNDYFIEGELRKHIWPLVLIIVGILFIFRPRKHSCNKLRDEKKNADGQPNNLASNDPNSNFSDEDYIDAVSIFGSTKKNILSKDFKGGDIVNIFGGTELNLTQADIAGKAELEITTIFGGSKLIVPANWSVKSEAVTIFGGIEDKRPASSIINSPEKVLLLKGTVIFGGIDIKSY